jgi:hypothetical protein
MCEVAATVTVSASHLCNMKLDFVLTCRGEYLKVVIIEIDYCLFVGL